MFCQAVAKINSDDGEWQDDELEMEDDWGAGGGNDEEEKYDPQMDHIVQEASGNTKDLQFAATVLGLGFKLFEY